MLIDNRLNKAFGGRLCFLYYLCCSHFDYSGSIQEFDYRIGRIKLIPFYCKIGSVWEFVVVVLKQLTKHQDIQKKTVF